MLKDAVEFQANSTASLRLVLGLASSHLHRATEELLVEGKLLRRVLAGGKTNGALVLIVGEKPQLLKAMAQLTGRTGTTVIEAHVRAQNLRYLPTHEGIVRAAKNHRARRARIDAHKAPGTGKTETVMQWARSCGRDIIHVDISSSKSMWFGESEKIIKKIFSDYRSACSGNGPKPILLFNEADAIFSCRRQLGSRDRSIHQTENAMQNIILEEMERLDGILIATTNLEGNLDGAFERRFLFKIRYEKPSLEAKMHIWRDKIGSLSEQDALRLASQFDFSGGEIDNIVRKATMEEVVSGAAPTLEMIESLCSHEKLPGGGRTRIGF